MSNAWREFNSAIHTLAGTGSIQKRLANAYIYHLMRIQENILPKELQQDFNKLGEDLTRVQAKGDEGNVAATTATMTDSKAREYVGIVISMYDKVVRYETKQGR